MIFIVPGVSTQVNDKVDGFCVNELQSRPTSKGQYGYEYVLNTSINELFAMVCLKQMNANKSKDVI